MLTANQIDYVQNVWNILNMTNMMTDLEFMTFDAMFKAEPSLVAIFQNSQSLGGNFKIDLSVYDLLQEKFAASKNSLPRQQKKKVNFNRYNEVFSIFYETDYDSTATSTDAATSTDVTEKTSLTASSREEKPNIHEDKAFRKHSSHVFYFLQMLVENLGDYVIIYSFACQMEQLSNHASNGSLTLEHYRLFCSCLESTIEELFGDKFGYEEKKAIGRFIEIVYFFVTYYLRGKSLIDHCKSFMRDNRIRILSQV